MGAASKAIDRSHFVWALASICGVHRRPFDPALVLQQFPPPYDLNLLQRAANDLGFRTGVRSVCASELHRRALPCLALLHPPAVAESSAEPRDAKAQPCTLGVVVSADADFVALARPGSPGVERAPLEEFEARFAGEIVEFAPAAAAPRDPDAAAKPREFGFRWFVPELLKHKPVWREVLGASLAIQLVGLAAPVLTQVVIDKVITHQTLNTLAVIAVALAMFMAFNALMTWVRQYLVLHTGNRVDAVLGSRVFEHLVELPPRYFELRPTGVITARVQGVETIREFVSGAAVALALDLPFLVLFVAIMFWYSWLLTLIVLAILAAIVVLSILVVPAIRARLNKQFLLGARNQAFLTEYVAGMETVKSLQMEPVLKRRFGEYLASYLAAGFNTRQLSNTYNAAANTLEHAMTILVLCFGAWLVMQGEGFTIGMLVAFQMFASRMSQPMLRLVGLWQELQQAAIAVKRLGDIMNLPTEPYSLAPARAPEQGAEIAAQALGFRHAETLPFLFRELDFTLKAGRCAALMGPSGCGKSTLAKLLQGFYLPTEGRILLNGQDTRHLAANELRQHFGVVPQETVLFSGTAYDNLALANPHAGFEQVVQACRLAEIHDAIEKLPEGYQTRIGERGATLSGGQKQRLAIARALLKRPKILIFDEATSSLDADTAEAFVRTVNQLKGRAAILFIAHHVPAALEIDAVVRIG